MHLAYFGCHRFASHRFKTLQALRWAVSEVECDERVYSVRMAGHEVSRLQLKESQRYVIVRQDRCIQVACSET